MNMPTASENITSTKLKSKYPLDYYYFTKISSFKILRVYITDRAFYS